MGKLKILIPTDFTVQAEYAYLMVNKLQEKIPVEVHFLHVMSVPDTITMDNAGKIQTCGDISESSIIDQKLIAERKLENLKTVYGDHIHVHFDLGKVTSKIVSYAETNNFDLVVMGTKGAWGFKEKLSGSETQMIARNSKIPVLSLMCDRSELVIKNILIVHDFTMPNKINLSLLNKLINAFQAKVHLLHILANESQRASLIQSMNAFAELNNIKNYESHILVDLDIENGVVHFNQMHQMDLICIGTQGKGGFFHSSITEKLVNHLFKPIISYHLNS